jgi:Uma2 family endonuclease
MAVPLRKVTYTFAEYLAIDAASEFKNEFLDGEIFAMSGGTIDHAALTANVTRLLGNALAGKRCRVLSADARIRVLATGLGTYPDVSVVCRAIETDPEDANTVVNPSLIVEVLSKSTEDYDRGKKFDHYKRIPSLRDYVLVSQREQLIEHFTRGSDGTWKLHKKARPPEVVKLLIGCELSVADVYFDPLESPEPLQSPSAR